MKASAIKASSLEEIAMQDIECARVNETSVNEPGTEDPAIAEAASSQKKTALIFACFCPLYIINVVNKIVYVGNPVPEAILEPPTNSLRPFGDFLGDIATDIAGRAAPIEREK